MTDLYHTSHGLRILLQRDFYLSSAMQEFLTTIKPQTLYFEFPYADHGHYDQVGATTATLSHFFHEALQFFQVIRDTIQLVS